MFRGYYFSRGSLPGPLCAGAIDSGVLPGQVKGSRTMLAGYHNHMKREPHNEKSPGRDDLGLVVGDAKSAM